MQNYPPRSAQLPQSPKAAEPTGEKCGWCISTPWKDVIINVSPPSLSAPARMQDKANARRKVVAIPPAH